VATACRRRVDGRQGRSRASGSRPERLADGTDASGRRRGP
jgi:hypothetical protein